MNQIFSSSISNALNFLINKKKSFLIIEFSDYYVQFIVDSNEVLIEAVSEYNMGIETGKFNDSFAEIGFFISEGDNYAKRFQIENIELMTESTLLIIENIYKVVGEISLNYNFGD